MKNFSPVIILRFKFKIDFVEKHLLQARTFHLNEFTDDNENDLHIKSTSHTENTCMAFHLYEFSGVFVNKILY